MSDYTLIPAMLVVAKELPKSECNVFFEVISHMNKTAIAYVFKISILRHIC